MKARQALGILCSRGITPETVAQAHMRYVKTLRPEINPYDELWEHCVQICECEFQTFSDRGYRTSITGEEIYAAAERLIRLVWRLV